MTGFLLDTNVPSELNRPAMYDFADRRMFVAEAGTWINGSAEKTDGL